jgi:hypothetical protein
MPTTQAACQPTQLVESEALVAQEVLACLDQATKSLKVQTNLELTVQDLQRELSLSQQQLADAALQQHGVVTEKLLHIEQLQQQAARDSARIKQLEALADEQLAAIEASKLKDCKLKAQQDVIDQYAAKYVARNSNCSHHIVAHDLHCSRSEHPTGKRIRCNRLATYKPKSSIFRRLPKNQLLELHLLPPKHLQLHG